jgi:carbamoyl-phosphate synthase small subunit
MTGYQEILTDPSYAGQIITFTFPHVGNVGCNDEDIEANTPHCSGLILRERPTLPSNFRSNITLDAWLKKNGISGICGIDTRALTRHIRKKRRAKCGDIQDTGCRTQAAESAEKTRFSTRYEWPRFS